MNIELKPYDRHVADEVISKLFNDYETLHSTPDGLLEIPAASYQIVVSALEAVRWFVKGEDREIIKRAIGIAERLRDQQKMVEWKRGEK